MKRTSRLGACAVLLIGGLAAVPATSHADILVLVDGSQVQTEGSWEVRGRLVVFRLQDGALSSLQLGEVDLDASEAATAAAKRAAEEARRPAAQDPTAQRRPPVLVLTDRDIARAAPHLAEEEPSTAPGDSSAVDESVPWEERQRLQIEQWEEAPSQQGLTFIGRVRNVSRDLTGALRVTATLFDHDDVVLSIAHGELSSSVLEPGRQATFRVRFPDVTHYERVEFSTGHVAVDSGEPPAREDLEEPSFDEG